MNPVSCIILAGGASKRMHGEDKGLVNYQGQPLIAHVIQSLQAQVDDFVISANRHPEQYQQFASKVIPDNTEMHGPLSGIAAALPHCQHDLVLVVACDMPALPDNLVGRLLSGSGNNEISIISVNNRTQLVFLMQKSLLASVQQHLSSGKYKLMRWIESRSASIIDCSECAEAFRNINSIQDIDQS